MKVFLSGEQIACRVKQIEAERSKLFKRQWKVKPFPRLEEQFERLRKHGIRIARALSFLQIGQVLADDAATHGCER